MFPVTWLPISDRNQMSILAELTHGGRQLQLVMAGLPLQVQAQRGLEGFAQQFELLWCAVSR